MIARRLPVQWMLEEAPSSGGGEIRQMGGNGEWPWWIDWLRRGILAIGEWVRDFFGAIGQQLAGAFGLAGLGAIVLTALIYYGRKAWQGR